MEAKSRHTFRQTKKNTTLLADLQKIATKLDRSLNYVFEIALLEYLKRNNKK